MAARLGGMVILGLVGFGVGMSVKDIRVAEPYDLWIILGSSIFGTLTGFLFTPYTFIPLFKWAIREMIALPIRSLIAAVGGLVIGLVLSILVLFAFSVTDLPDPWDKIVPVLVSVPLAFLGVMVAVLREKELLGLILLRQETLAGVPGSAGIGVGGNGASILIDTSAIIDGRIADITHTGFVNRELVIPRFVLDELQYVADSSDSLRRSKGRRGLDVLNRLRKDEAVSVEILDVEVKDVNGVDGKLVTLAKRSDYSILTTDFNLNKVAELQGVEVLNINELANSLKPALLPGEELSIQITQEGKEEGQGVGYLDDGTMIVVEGGRDYLETQQTVVITRVLQTSAGRIIFAHLK